jgi:hypothetical protein
MITITRGARRKTKLKVMIRSSLRPIFIIHMLLSITRGGKNNGVFAFQGVALCCGY